MTKDRKDDDITDLFDEAEVISSYSSRQAVEDGILFDVNELGKVHASPVWQEGPFQYVTTNLCSKGYLKDGETPSIPNFLDLFRTMHEHMRRNGPDHHYSKVIEFPDGTTGTVYAKRNEHHRYTLMLPDDD